MLAKRAGGGISVYRMIHACVRYLPAFTCSAILDPSSTKAWDSCSSFYQAAMLWTYHCRVVIACLVIHNQSFSRPLDVV